MLQKENLLTICQELENDFIHENFIQNIITGDEILFCGYDPKTKLQLPQ